MKFRECAITGFSGGTTIIQVGGSDHERDLFDQMSRHSILSWRIAKLKALWVFFWSFCIADNGTCLSAFVKRLPSKEDVPINFFLSIIIVLQHNS